MINPDKKLSYLNYQPLKDTVKDHAELKDTYSPSAEETLVKQEIPAKKKGKLLIQLDGVSYDDLKKAIEQGYAPNIKEMIEKENYALKQFLCGLPAASVSIQGELFYGIALPGNEWYNKQTKKIVVAEASEPSLQEQTRGLLADGSTYSASLTGGASKSNRGLINLKKVSIADLLGNNGIKKSKEQRDDSEKHSPKNRLFRQTVEEQGLSSFEIVRNCYKKVSKLRKEFKNRGNYRNLIDKLATVFLSVTENALFPMIAQGIKNALAKGSPVIYTDIDLYDNSAHYLEPQTKEAFEALQSADTLVGKLKKMSRETKTRDYNVILFADHGQTKCESFGKEFGKSINDLILEFANEITGHRRANKKDIVFTSVYSMGNLYFNSIDGIAKISEIEEKYPALIKKMLNHKGIDMVAGREDDQVIVYGKNGKVTISDHVEVEGEDPLARYKDVGSTELVARQIKEYAHIPQTGDLILFAGWKKDDEIYEFSDAYTFDGAHGGLGGPQSRPFILCNDEDPIDTSNVIRVTDMYPQLKEIVDETK